MDKHHWMRSAALCEKSRLVAMLVEGDEEFNRWSRDGAKRQAEKGQPIVYIRINRIQPVRSRIEELEITA